MVRWCGPSRKRTAAPQPQNTRLAFSGVVRWCRVLGARVTAPKRRPPLATGPLLARSLARRVVSFCAFRTLAPTPASRRSRPKRPAPGLSWAFLRVGAQSGLARACVPPVSGTEAASSVYSQRGEFAGYKNVELRGLVRWIPISVEFAARRRERTFARKELTMANTRKTARRVRKEPKPAVVPADTKPVVYRFEASVRERARAARDAAKVSMQKWLAAAVDQQLAKLVEELLGAGLPTSGPRKLARWFMGEETLAALREASEKVGLPAKQLLSAVVVRQSTLEAVVPTKAEKLSEGLRKTTAKIRRAKTHR